MKVRSDLMDLIVNINAADLVHSGSSIKIGATQSTITELSKQILDKMDKYLNVECSPKGRLKTLAELKKSVVDLLNKPEIDTTAKQDLLSTAQRIDFFVKKTEDWRNNVKNGIRPDIYFDKNKFLNDLPTSSTELIRGNAYRTVKDVNYLEESIVTGVVGGSFPFISFLSLKKNLQTFINSYQSTLTIRQIDQIKEVMSLIEEAAPIDRELSLWSLVDFEKGATKYSLDKKIADLAYDIEQKIENLKIGGSVLVPGGFMHKDGGHAVVYDIQRVRENEYHFSVLNTGLGAKFGQEGFRKIKMFFNLTAESDVPLIVNLSKEAVSDQSFLIELLRPRATVSNNNRMESVYEAIYKHLIEKSRGNQTIREPHKLQSWGTCSYDSVAAFLEYKLPPSIFIPFHFDMILRSRWALNLLIPQGKIDQVYDQNTRAILDYIDAKSCETVAEFNKKFKQHCEPQEDWLVAKEFIGNGKVKDEAALKALIEELSDKVFSLDERVDKENPVVMGGIVNGFCGVFTATIGYLTMLAAPATGPAAPLVWALGGGLTGLSGLLTLRAAACTIGMDCNDLEISRRGYIQFMKIVERIIAQTSPKQAEIIATRMQALTPSTSRLDSVYETFSSSKNRPVLGDLDLSGLLQYLQDRYSEIAMCVPALLDATQSPLHDALQGCNMLPAGTR